MNLIKDRTVHLPEKIPGLTPLYALIGITDLTVETLRELGAKEDVEGGATAAKSRATGDVMYVVKGAAQVPAIALSQTRSVLGRGQVEYVGLAKRGEKFVEGLRPTAERMMKDGETVVDHEVARTEKVAKRLFHQAEETVARGRSIATHAATDAQKKAESTLRSMRAEAEHVVDAVTHPGRVPAPKGTAAARPAPKTGGARRRRTVAADTAVHSTIPSAKAGERPTATAGVSVEAASTADTTRKAAAKKAPAKRATPRKTAARKRTTVASAAVVAPGMPEANDAAELAPAFGVETPEPSQD